MEDVIDNPDFLPAHLVLAIVHNELGREEEARAEVAEILRISPSASLEGQREDALQRSSGIGAVFGEPAPGGAAGEVEVNCTLAKCPEWVISGHFSYPSVMSALGGKADVNHCVGECPLLAISGHSYDAITHT